MCIKIEKLMTSHQYIKLLAFVGLNKKMQLKKIIKNQIYTRYYQDVETFKKCNKI